MLNDSHILGIDIGSVSVSAAEINSKKEIIRTAYACHNGNIAKVVRNFLLQNFDLDRIGGIAVTTSTPPVIHADRKYDNRIAVISAARYFYPDVRSILIIGGERFGLIRFDENGQYEKYKANTSCAVGTGSFLDQQAERLQLESTSELSRQALANQGMVPKIASRCAVFAKTDLVHAQQEGFTIPEICDGLCYGLAKNVADTLLKGEQIAPPILITGGVSRNLSVVRHLEGMIGQTILHSDTIAYGAIGAALHFLTDGRPVKMAGTRSIDEIIAPAARAKKYFFAPLESISDAYPDFSDMVSYNFLPPGSTRVEPVEVEIYPDRMPTGRIRTYLGIDIGSTSTKAVLMGTDKCILAGFYTKTAGKPVAAVQNLFAAISDFTIGQRIDLAVAGTGTTGAGRKLIAKIINADWVVDEITAHARAASELHPDVDTIIEIGGQDSKFTTLSNGRVTAAVMNHVCAAGTGSFIEEQAKKLGCPLSDYSAKAMHRRAPISSDRCTVFMERDLNHYLSEGFALEEILASVLHAVTENYLTKVAVERNIGSTICFQGATAKNRALVAAFEQRLNRPILVSKYCHLTGAAGTALLLLDRGITASGFRGLDLYQDRIPITSETCDLCSNHCKLTVAHVKGETVAYGFLCGRDYQTKKHVDNNRSGFDLIKARKTAVSFHQKEPGKDGGVGIPAMLPIFEDLPFWKKFFNALSIKTISSESFGQGVKKGKKLSGAEFCAPMTAFYGHVRYLMDRADIVFLPFYFKKKPKEKAGREQLCYYTQFSSALVSAMGDADGSVKWMTPLVHHDYTSFHTKIELYKSLKKVLKTPVRFFDVSAAYDEALSFQASYTKRLKAIYPGYMQGREELHVVLLGRPYTVLSEHMNKGIPKIFASFGIKTFFQDMLSYRSEDVRAVNPLINDLHWYYAARILEAACVTAQTANAYPVLITSFKCSPDSFVIDYFKSILESHGKPYLILQLDEHDSRTGYETRIEAAVRSFQNHHAQHKVAKRTDPVPAAAQPRKHRLNGKTLIIPNWDDVAMRLVVANLQKEGIDACLLQGNETSAQKGLRYNTGKCIPLNIIAQEFIDHVERHNLDPSRTALWLADSTLGCNLPMFPHYIQRLLNAYGNGMEKAGIYIGLTSFMDISLKLPINTYLAYMFGGLLKKMLCRIRPYEKSRGATDRAFEQSIGLLTDAFSGQRSKADALEEVIPLFEAIDRSDEQKPKVAIFGDLYVRDNDRMNQNLIRLIEENGGEVVTTPYSAYIKMIAGQYLRKWFTEGKYISVLSSKALISTVYRLEKTYYRYFERILKEPDAVYDDPPEKILAKFRLLREHTGESMDNVLKIHYLKKQYPDLALLIQTNPAFCCPSLVTEAMAKQIEHEIHVPIITITYDGTESNKNDLVIPYLTYVRSADKHAPLAHPCHR